MVLQHRRNFLEDRHSARATIVGQKVVHRYLLPNTGARPPWSDTTTSSAPMKMICLLSTTKSPEWVASPKGWSTDRFKHWKTATAYLPRTSSSKTKQSIGWRRRSRQTWES